MKILYIAPENTVGTLSLWKQAHTARGNECRFVTLYPTRHDYDPGLCLNLPLVAARPWYMRSRHQYYKFYRGQGGDYREKEGFPPLWRPHSDLEAAYFRMRDWLWHFRIEPFIREQRLLDYDIYHLEWGLEFYRDGRFARRLAQAGKRIACTYHGQDLRTRGVIPAIDAISRLNLTSEVDLLRRHPSIRYLFLPCDTGRIQPRREVNARIRICHSPTDRYYKGSDTIIPVCRRLEREENVEFVLVENRPHAETQAIKAGCDILVDQVHNRGGWGYGMNSVEALTMGLCCVTELVPEYEDFIPDHPFVNVTGDSLYERLQALVRDRTLLAHYQQIGRAWVERKHGLHNTAAVLYGYYEELGWL